MTPSIIIVAGIPGSAGLELYEMSFSECAPRLNQLKGSSGLGRRRGEYRDGRDHDRDRLLVPPHCGAFTDLSYCVNIS